ncbi:MAG: hypothetical protein HN542_03870 [Flavobacteriales bacterium]|jgi:hypothetical protein|nr:hypothetical protein [Flavobacteriales bacterium]NCG29264.1 hypothetical protein [Bacteroidota bacterium]MBT3964363.1 hypothetical protein [Flavobacteriales bacterium]MBT4705147.1 hypothetical protein [Flavobacteriales bacterium]MBT4930167.1 hypothetical protein [Flavobacteriales bacterium]
MRFLIIALLGAVIMQGCLEPGCTNHTASNYNQNATKDDGSCYFSGCTDRRALNYDERADREDGTCIYPGQVHFYNRLHVENDHRIDIYWDSEYVGFFDLKCPFEVFSCTSGCEVLEIDQLYPDTIRFAAIYRPDAGVGDTIQQGKVIIEESECTAVVIQ